MIINDFFWESDPIDAALPLDLDNGAIVESLDCYCSRCYRGVRREHLRGAVRAMSGGFRITSFGLCVRCNLLTPYMYDCVPAGENFSLEKREWRGWEPANNIVSVDFGPDRK